MPPSEIDDARGTLDRVLAQWRRERPDIDPAPMAVCGAVWRAGRRLSDGLRDNLARHDLDFAEMDVLLTLRRSGAAAILTPSAMAADMMLSAGAMTARLDRLEARGLITRARDPDDRRKVGISLTPAGLALADRVVVGHVAAEEAMLAPLDDEERATLRRLLERIADPSRTPLKSSHEE